MTDPKAIEALLPQTQCRQCGYADCADYARAISEGELHNRCPAGGDKVILRLSTLLGREPLTLNPECGVHVPEEVARIEASRCIGCCLCITACPTEAIIGCAKHLHTVDEDRCNGCCLCQIACPVDCIDMVRISRPWSDELAAVSKKNYLAKKNRVTRRKQMEEERLNQKSLSNKKEFLTKLLQKKLKS